MKTNIDPLQSDAYYHVYNRGINGENIFKENRNYRYFLQKFAAYVTPVADTYAYCLLKNHFHFLIRTRSEAEIVAHSLREREDFPKSNSLLKRDLPWMISNAFASTFKSYTQSVNKAHQRTGRLFEQPFRRILVDNDAYFRELVYYIHNNPKKHGFVTDFRDYEHSSYHSLLHTAATRLKRLDVMDWFGTKDDFINYHSRNDKLQFHDRFAIEFD